MDNDFKPDLNDAPDWATAPDWAKFRALDIYGWYWYEKQPTLEDGIWIVFYGRMENAFGKTITPICEPRPSGQTPEQ